MTKKRISKAHQDLLREAAIDIKVAREAGVHSTSEGLVFPYRSPDGSRIIENLRPDDPGDGPKYRWPTGEPLVLNTHPRMDALVRGSTSKVLVVEGTKQYLAAVSAAPADTLVLGINGCQGYRQKDNGTISDLGLVDWAGRDVVVIFDADLKTNPDVWDAAEGLGEDLEFRSVSSVVFGYLPGGGTAGLDDVLAEYGPSALTRVLTKAGKLPRRPAKKRASGPADRFFDETGLLVEKLGNEALREWPMAVDSERKVCLYDGGVYAGSRGPQTAAVELLGDRFRAFHEEALKRHLEVRLERDGRVIPDHASDPILNVPNGLLDLLEAELHPHSPEFMSAKQIVTEWHLDAECPTYEKWANEVIGDQLLDLEEAASLMLDPSRTPTKALFMFGPSRSGKSTFIRLLEQIVGPRHRSAVTLHQLGKDGFAAANIFGSILNSAADLSAAHVEDLSTFKMLTGEDTIQANRKFGSQFTFQNTALFAFSANEVPSVGESSNAYLERVKPFRFDQSFAGAEDRTIERAMYAELPGILRRLVEGYGRWTGRGGYGPTNPSVLADFSTKSDRVRMFVVEELEELPADTPVAQWTSGPSLLAMFTTWAEANHVGKLGRNKFYDRLRSMGYEPQADGRTRVNFRLRKRKPGDSRSGHSGHSELTRPHTRGPGGEEEKSPREGTTRTNVQNVQTRDPFGKLLATGRPTPIDLETHSTAELFAGSDGPFIRLVGEGRDVHEDPDALVARIRAGQAVVAHNGFRFDFIALAVHHDLDILELGDRGLLLDTLPLAYLHDPLVGGQKYPTGHFGLDQLGERLGAETSKGDLKAIAKRYAAEGQCCSFGHIDPADDEFRKYLADDVALQRHIIGSMLVNEYARREMRVMSRLAGSITVEGFRVDLDLLADRLQTGEADKLEAAARVRELTGVRGEKSDGSIADLPQSTASGKAALAEWFAERDVDIPTSEAGNPKLGKEVMSILVDQLDPDDEVAEVASLILASSGSPAVYGTIDRNLVGDRVHPTINPKQASGRFSITGPGLTIFGKRGDLWKQREVMLPDTPDEVLLAVDLNQIDARAIAVHSQDHDYLDLFEGDVDSHMEVAELVFGERTKEARGRAKAIAHGWNYGEGVKRIARDTGLGLEAAQAFDTAMAERFPRLVEWRSEVRQMAESGELLDNGFGRMMKCDPDRAWTQAPAMMGQGTARDLLTEGILRLDLDVVRRLRAIVHDEIVLSVPFEDADDYAEAITAALSFDWAPPGADRPVSVMCGVEGLGTSWGAIYRKEAS